jgi:hypothetical protein
MLTVHGDVKTARLSVCSASFKPNPFLALNNENGSKQWMVAKAPRVRMLGALENALCVFKMKT